MLRYEVDGGTAWLTLDRPEKLNALSAELYAELQRRLLEADDDPDVDLIVLRATGDEYFCSGGDLTGFGTNGDPLPDALRQVDFPYETFERVSKLVVCVINGKAWAAGVDLALVSDLVIASDRATFRIPEALWGVIDPISPHRLAPHIGLGRARWMLYTTDIVDAAEAERIGLIGKVVPHEELEEALGRLLSTLRRTGPGARAAHKHLVNQSLAPILWDRFFDHMGSAEAAEGMASFAARRPPTWQAEP